MPSASTCQTLVRGALHHRASRSLTRRGECSWAVTLARGDWRVETRSRTDDGDARRVPDRSGARGVRERLAGFRAELASSHSARQRLMPVSFVRPAPRRPGTARPAGADQATAPKLSYCQSIQPGSRRGLVQLRWTSTFTSFVPRRPRTCPSASGLRRPAASRYARSSSPRGLQEQGVVLGGSSSAASSSCRPGRTRTTA